MTLLNKILEWTKTLPDWQRDAARRLLVQKDGLYENDYSELYTLLKAEHGLPNPDQLKPVPLESTHLPTNPTSYQTITLKEMRELSNVNCIALNQKLIFSETGISVIYGGNGSGKSGYVRVMKRACRSRDQLEAVHTNANDPFSTILTPEAIFKIEKNGKEKDVCWKMGGPPSDILSMISIFDSRCARSYLTTQQDVAYLPYGLDIVENLANNVLPKLNQKLGEEINSIDRNINVFNHLLDETEVGKHMSKLSAKTNPYDTKELGTLSEEELKKIAALSKALEEADPIAKANDIKRLVSRLKNLSENIKKISLRADYDAVQRLKILDDEVVKAESAERKAAQILQSGENLLPGTGEQLWKTLFEAARKYSTTAAYPDQKFPYTGEGAVCPLCQSSPDDLGKKLERFDRYIKNDVAKIANEKREHLSTIKKKIEAANFTISLDEELSDEIGLLDGSIIMAVTTFQKRIDEQKQLMLEALNTHDWENLIEITNSPWRSIRNLAALKLKEARTFIKAADAKRKNELTQEHNELISRQNLGKSLKGLLALIERMKKVATLEKCKKDLKTTVISNKSRELASDAVTKELKNALDIEFKSLNVGYIKTKLKEKNVKGKIYHQLLLEIPTNIALDEVLSEGEQRAIAIGSFFAELSLANHSCGIVFDDPVSSLDHLRRQYVAHRFVKEAQKRQVIIFTHDTSFLGQLRDEINEKKVKHKFQFLEWKGKYSGNVCDGLPWGHSSYTERIDAVEREHRRLASKPWPIYPTDKDTGEMMVAYGRLRASIERVVQDVVFGGVIGRYRDWIIIGKLKDVVGFEESECNEINRLHHRCSTLTDAHDPASAKNNSVPTPAELDKDIQDLKTVIKIIKVRRQAKKIATP